MDFHDFFSKLHFTSLPTLYINYLCILVIYGGEASKRTNKRKTSFESFAFSNILAFVVHVRKMDPILFSIFFATLLAALLPLFKRYKKYSALQAIVNKIPGPKAYPVVGTSLPYIMTPREGHRRQLIPVFDY